MLKMTGVELGKIVDIEIYLFIVKGLRGEISYIGKRKSEANNKKYIKNYDSTNPSIYKSYLDMNNLYGWVMSGYLLYGGFKWLKSVDSFDVNWISKENPVGNILEVDLKYPKKLQVLRNDYPSASEKLAISYDMLSDYFKKIAGEY